MMGRNYYCLVAGLPDIIYDDKKLAFSSVKLREYLQEELHPKDLRLMKLFYYQFDTINLLNLLFRKGKKWEERGIFTAGELEQIINPGLFNETGWNSFPDYILRFGDFLRLREELEEKLSYDESFRFLTSAYYENMLTSSNEFVRDYAEFRINTGNILLALNGRKYHIPFENAIIGDNYVTDAIRKNRTRDFDLSKDYPEIENLIRLFDNGNLLERELKLDYRQWNFLDEITFFHYFSIEKVLAFVLKIFIAERWYHLDYEKGQVMFNRILNDIESSFEYSDEFKDFYGKK